MVVIIKPILKMVIRMLVLLDVPNEVIAIPMIKAISKVFKTSIVWSFSFCILCSLDSLRTSGTFPWFNPLKNFRASEGTLAKS